MGRNVQEILDEAGRVFDAPLKEWLEAKHAHLMMQLEDLLSQHNAQGDGRRDETPPRQ
jgi:hypothetical protein